MIFKKILRMTYIQKLFFKISNFWRISLKIQPPQMCLSERASATTCRMAAHWSGCRRHTS